ncbi:MAG: hypothetical protein Q7R96_04275 [Nanoarchaeota archaeon]|nr:hypothetical protein [Nanoarchaeota archaeon]
MSDMHELNALPEERRSTSYIILGANILILGAALAWVIHRAKEEDITNYTPHQRIAENLPTGTYWTWIDQERVVFDKQGEPLGYMRFSNANLEDAARTQNPRQQEELTLEERTSPLKFYPDVFSTRQALNLRQRHQEIKAEEKQRSITK